jgi:hypothetical protein
MAQTVSQRAASAGIAPVYGMAGMNAASANAAAAGKTAGASIADPNFGLTQTMGGLNDIKTAFGPGGTANSLVSAIQKYMAPDQSAGTPENTINETAMNADEAAAATNAQNYMRSLMSGSNSGGFG